MSASDKLRKHRKLQLRKSLTMQRDHVKQARRLRLEISARKKDRRRP